MWWFAGFICIATILAVSGWLVYLGLRSSAGWEESQKKLEREGTTILGWIVFANDNLYKRNRNDNRWDCQVVFTLESIPNLEETLERWAKEIRNFETENKEDDDERIIGQIVKIEIGYHHPLRIPKRITGRVEAFTATIPVETMYLPESYLTLPYIYCKVILHEDTTERSAMHIPYPRRRSSAQGLPIARSIRDDGTISRQVHAQPMRSPLVDFANLEFPRGTIRKDYTGRLALIVVPIGAALSICLVLVVVMVMTIRGDRRRAELNKPVEPDPVPKRPIQTGPPQPSDPIGPPPGPVNLGDLAGQWTRVTDGLTERWTITFIGGVWEVSGRFLDGETDVGGFVGEQIETNEQGIKFVQKFVKSPPRGWLSGANYTVWLSGGKLRYTWEIGGSSGTREMLKVNK